MVIDEIQRVPELLLAIKQQVDTDERPGRYLLTGSAKILGLRGLPDTLPGRTEPSPGNAGHLLRLPHRPDVAALTSGVIRLSLSGLAVSA